MTKEKLTRFLQTNGLVSQAQAEDITQDFVAHTISKNDFFLLQTGTVSDDYFFLDSGFMRAFVFDRTYAKGVT